MINYIKSSVEELKNNVSWTKRSEAQRLVIVVALFSVIFSLAIWGVDTLLEVVISQYFQWVK